MKLYNTLTKRIEEFIPVKEGQVGIYMCGMTVQDRPHLGHIRSFLVGDVLRRYFEYKGLNVEYVQNFTDIDDKIIARMHDENIDWRDVGWKYTEEYLRAADKLNIKKATHYPRATQFIQEIIELIEELINKGFAYVTPKGNVYFEVSKFPEYGKLSGKKLDELREGARVEPDPEKKNPFDFALWKTKKEGEPYWYSPWGKGRPGWHIECSAMSTHFLGQPFDIHMGGQDLIFPHHEDEIAQAEAAHGKKFVNYWVHIGFMQIKGEKMSKSTGLFFAIEDILNVYDPNAVRLFILQKHYRTPMDYAEEFLKNTEEAWKKLNEVMKNAQNTENKSLNAELIKSFEEAMEDDLNTPRAIGHIFSYIKNHPDDPFTPAFLLKVLGFYSVEKGSSDILDNIMDAIIKVRTQLRKDKQFKYADMIRDELANIGISLKDSKDGTTWSF